MLARGTFRSLADFQPGVQMLLQQSCKMSSASSDMVAHVKQMPEAEWSQAAQILQGGVDRATSSTVGPASPDALLLSTTLAELHFLQGEWAAVQQAVDAVQPDPAAMHGVQDPSTPVTETQNKGGGVDHVRGLRYSLKHMAGAAQGMLSSESGVVPEIPRLAREHAQALRVLSDTSQPPVEGSTAADSGSALARLQCAHVGLMHLSRGQDDKASTALSSPAGKGQERSVSAWEGRWQALADLDAHALQAQHSLRQKQWSAAEESLSAATTLSEGVPHMASSGLALPLVLLASAYAHQGQVTYAEGLLRKAADCLQLSAETTSAGAATGTSSTALATQSVKALTAHSMAQLYAAMPKRSTESDKWAQSAKAYWPFDDQLDQAAGAGEVQALQTQLGGVDALSADGTKGMGPVVSCVLGRLFLCRTTE